MPTSPPQVPVLNPQSLFPVLNPYSLSSIPIPCPQSLSPIPNPCLPSPVLILIPSPQYLLPILNHQSLTLLPQSLVPHPVPSLQSAIHYLKFIPCNPQALTYYPVLSPQLGSPILNPYRPLRSPDNAFYYWRFRVTTVRLGVPLHLNKNSINTVLGKCPQLENTHINSPGMH